METKPKISPKLIASNIALYRQELGYSFKDIAEATGLKENDLRAFETLEKTPSGDVILILAGFYNIEYIDLLTDQKQKEMFDGLGDEPIVRREAMKRRFLNRNAAFLLKVLRKTELSNDLGNDFFGIFEDETECMAYLEKEGIPVSYASLCFEACRRGEITIARLKELILY